LLNRGSAYASKGAYKNALADFQAAMNINPSFASTYYSMAAIYLVTNKPALAAAYATQALGLDPKGDWQGYTEKTQLGDVYDIRGLAELQMNLPGRAFQDFDRAVATDPNQGRFYFLRGVAHAQLHQFDAAFADLARADTLDGTKAAVPYELGAVYIRLRDYPHAIAALSRSIADNPNFSSVWALRCRARALSGDLAGAQSDCDQAVSTDSEDFGAHIARGYVELKLGKWIPALLDYQTAVLLKPKSATAHYGKVLARRGVSPSDSATEDFTVATTLDPAIAIDFAAMGETPAEAELPFQLMMDREAPSF
jgi:tetratricopeptide (TPR) repeat protein